MPKLQGGIPLLFLQYVADLCDHTTVIALSLQSGSSGNSIYVETDDARLLFDAGISCSGAAHRLAARGIDARTVDALIISHDHGDHVRHAGVYQRRFGVPLFISPRTLDRARSRHSLGTLSHIHYFLPGGLFRINDTVVETLP
ncbi:MAG: MBL fold metallo-hydrolase, partial [Nitrospiraceae bacterium]